MTNPEAYADVVVLTIKSALAPVLARLSVSEERNKELQTRLEAFTELRDRLIAVETKSAAAVAPHVVDISPVLDRIANTEAQRDRIVADEVKAFATRLEQIEALKTAPVVGPAGPAGEPGPPGPPGPAGEIPVALETRLMELESTIKAMLPVGSELSAEECATHLAELFTKELAAVEALPRMQKRVIRDAHGKVERVIEEPVA
jgi:Asp-tRNA(Asn)/Glu-tRNA(Gln) amidotransferase C subunit